MSRTSESTNADTNELRCSCGKCLAKDGRIKCAKCGNLTEVVRRVAEAEAMHALAALAVAGVDSGGDKPVKISILPRSNYLGYVQYQPDPHKILTLKDMEARLTAVCAQALADNSTGSSHSFELASQMAKSIVYLTSKHLPFQEFQDAVHNLIREHIKRAEKVIAENKELIEELSAKLAEKGELTAEELAAFFEGRIPRAS